MDRLLALFDGYQRIPNRKPKHISAKDWEQVILHRAELQAQLSPKCSIYRMRLPEHTVRGLQHLQARWGIKSYGKTISYLVEEALRAHSLP